MRDRGRKQEQAAHMSHEQVPQPQFLVYVMWHLDSKDCGPVADAIRTHFQSPRFRHVTGDEKMDVVFRSERTPTAFAADVAWDAACPIAIVVMVDRHVAADPEWREHLDRLGKRAATEGFRTRVIPVAIESAVLERIAVEEQAIRWDEWATGPEAREARLLRELTYEFGSMIRHHLHRPHPSAEGADEMEAYLEKIQVFLSHSKHDSHGARIAHEIRNWLHANSTLSSFLDVRDIRPGLPFPSVIEHQVEHSIMLAIYTDSYSSREWCRREVVEAKRHGVPMVVADCLHEGDDRAFPYLGNVPVVRMDPKSPDRIPQVVSRLLDEVLRDMLWKSRVAALREEGSLPIFMGRPPEFASLASRGWHPGRSGVIVHPYPPLGDVEKALLQAAWSGIRLLSMNQWLAEMS